MCGAKKRAGSSRGSPAAEASDVEEILRAAEDELLIGLHVGSHTISSSSPDRDLARRFDALKTPRLPPPPKATLPNLPPQHSAPQSKPLETKHQILGDAMNDDLMARFAALKFPTSKPQPMVVPISNREDSTDDEPSEDGYGGDKVSKKELEKLMMWAMDAARIDPSVRSDEDDVDVDKQSDEEEEDDKESESEVEDKKRSAKGEVAHGKWFSLFR